MSSPLDGKKIGFLGAGAMASAMMKGLIAAGVSPANLSCSDPWDVARDRAEALGIVRRVAAKYDLEPEGQLAACDAHRKSERKRLVGQIKLAESRLQAEQGAAAAAAEEMERQGLRYKSEMGELRAVISKLRSQVAASPPPPLAS